jgi:hypothetical protein
VSVRWTPDMLAALARMRAERVPLYICAERIGVSYKVAVHKARELGLATRFNRGRRSGASVQHAEP